MTYLILTNFIRLTLFSTTAQKCITATYNFLIWFSPLYLSLRSKYSAKIIPLKILLSSQQNIYIINFFTILTTQISTNKIWNDFQMF